jgi:signal transduction histidine kinase/ActR/RegA family two-component response regulator
MNAIRVLDVGANVAADLGERIDGRPVDTVTVPTLAAAVDRVDADVDCVVTAYDLPDGDGVAVLRAIRDRVPVLPVVIVAEAGSEAAASDAIAAGVTDYVPRSPDVDLGARIAAAVRDAPDAPSTDGLDVLRDAFPDLGFVVDADGQISEALAGPTAATHLPDAPATLSGRRLDGILPATLVAATRSVLETGTERTVEYDLAEPSGTEWFEARVAPADGNRAVIVARRITDRKRERRDLRRQQSHLAQAQEVARIGSWYRHFPSADLWWSEMVYDIFGRPRDAGPPTHETFLSSVHPEDRADVTDRWQAALDGDPYDVEHRILVDGETRWVRERADFSFDDEGNPLEAVGVVHDVTDRKEYERRLETTNERLDVLHRVARHDIRNRMNVVLGCAAELRRALDPDRAPLRMVDRIETAAKDLLDISRQLRKADSVVTNDPDRQPVDVATLVAELVEEFADCAPDVEWYVAVPDSLAVRAPSTLVVALTNVIENAVAHNEGARQRVAIVTEHDADRVEIRVVDDGPGIPAVERELLVGDRERTQVAHSSGLGLWLTRWIVGNAGGSLDIHDGRRGGTVVTVELPSVDGDELQRDG